MYPIYLVHVEGAEVHVGRCNVCRGGSRHHGVGRWYQRLLHQTWALHASQESSIRALETEQCMEENE